MLLEQRSVSRKTPLDGKLEVSAATAACLAALGAEFAVFSAGRPGRGQLQALACTCAKGAGEQHIHHFVESPLFRELTPGVSVRVELDERTPAVRVESVEGPAS